MKKLTRALLIGAATLVSMPAHALTQITFAEFSGAGANWFNYTTAGAANGGTVSGNTTVAFFAQGLGFSELVTGTNFVLTGSSSTGPSDWALGANSSQIFQTGSLTFTASAAYAAAHGGLANLLTVTFSNAVLNVTPTGSSNISFAATDGETQFDSSVTSVSYSSDFFDFTGTQGFNFAFSPTGTSAPVVVPNASFGTYNSFKASGPGSFAAAVPEPDQWAMLLVGFGLVGATMRRRRNMSMVTA